MEVSTQIKLLSVRFTSSAASLGTPPPNTGLAHQTTGQIPCSAKGIEVIADLPILPLFTAFSCPQMDRLCWIYQRCSGDQLLGMQG